MTKSENGNHEKPYAAKDRAEIFRFMQRGVYGDCVKDTDAAVALAEVLIERNFGKEVLQQQQPLTAQEDGDAWIVKGSLAKIQPKLADGPVIIRLTKADAKVESMYLSVAGPEGFRPLGESKK